MKIALQISANLAVAFAPFMPKKAKQLQVMLGIEIFFNFCIKDFINSRKQKIYKINSI